MIPELRFATRLVQDLEAFAALFAIYGVLQALEALVRACEEDTYAHDE